VTRREKLTDAALAVGVTLVVAVAITANLGGGRGPDVAAYMFAVGLGLLMLIRRRYPGFALLTTAVGILGYHAADYPPVGLAAPVAAALFSAAEFGRTRLAAGVAAALLLISGFFRLREGDDLGYLVGYELGWTVALMAGAIAFGDGVRNRRRAQVEQREREERLIREREQQAAMRIEQERLAIARDLHDVLAHTVAVISVQADVAAEALADSDTEAVRSALTAIRTAGNDATRELRSAVDLLRRPAETDLRSPTGSLRHVDRLVDSMRESGLPVAIRTEGEPVPLPTMTDTTAYRIVQEALTNALRHANATRVEVVLRYGSDRLEIDVTDDGRGADDVHAADDVHGDKLNLTPSPSRGGDASGAGDHEPEAGGHARGEDGHGLGTGGRGLAGMRERAELIGGTLTMGPRPEGGFQVRASLPLPAHAATSS